MAALKAALTQLGTWGLLFGLAQLGLLPAMGGLALALCQGALAVTLAWLLKSDRWWLPIHLFFSAALLLTLRADIAPAWFLAAFLILGLTYWTSFRTQVPLYLTNHATADTLLQLLPDRPVHFLDLGCGTGGLLRRLARARPDCQFVGIETAPLPWLVAWLACRGLTNCRILRDDFWRSSLKNQDWVYAFLSPVPMARLGAKAAAELQTGACLISNSFPLPDQAADETIGIPDRRTTRLYLYRY